MSTLFVETIEFAVPVPVPRTRKKMKLKLNCTNEDNMYNIHLDTIVPPKRTKKKLRDSAGVNLKTNVNDNIGNISCEEVFLDLHRPNVCNVEKVINYEFVSDVDSESNEIKSVSSIKNDKGPKIVKLIQKSLSESNETSVIVNSNNKADVNNVPKMNFYNKKSTIGFGKILRDSEDDSGVYFSDSSKVSPIKLQSDMDTKQNAICFNNSENNCYVCINDAFCIKSQPNVYNNNNNINNNNNNCIITSDSVDNKNETNLGPLKQLDSSVINPLVSVLDSFEAEILNTFKESTFGIGRLNTDRENEKLFVGEQLNQYFEDMLSTSESNEEGKENNEITDIANDRSIFMCNGYETGSTVVVGSKVYKETVSETCNNIFPCVSSNSHNDLDSTINVDYPSTNLGFIVNECSSSDFLNTTVVNNDVMNLVSSIYDFEASSQEMFSSDSNNNSPVNVDVCNSYVNAPSDFSYDCIIPLNEQFDGKTTNPIAYLEITADKGIVNDFNETNDKIVVNNYKNTVKSLINFFERIVQDTPQFNDNAEDGVETALNVNSNLNGYSCVKNIDDNEKLSTSQTEVNHTDTVKKITKCVSFSDDLVIINNVIERETTQADSPSSVSSEDVVSECNNIVYERLTVTDDNSSELFSSVSSDEVIEEKCIEILPLIVPADESKFLEILESISSNISDENMISSCKNYSNDGDKLWRNEHEDYHSETSVKDYLSFLEQNNLSQRPFSPSVEFKRLNNSSIDDSSSITDWKDPENSNSVLEEVKHFCETIKEPNKKCYSESKEDSYTLICCSETNMNREDKKNINEIADNGVENFHEVILEKVWGSIGIKLEKDTETDHLFVSELLHGGAAESSGLVSIGSFKFFSRGMRFFI